MIKTKPNAVLAIAITALMLSAPIAFALPAPINFQRSITWDVFNSTTATVYELDNPQNAPFEVFLNNRLTYGDTGTLGAIIKLQDATTGSMNALEIIVYNTKAIDINWTDKETSSTTKIGGIDGTELQEIPREITITNSGTSLSVSLGDGTLVVEDFVLPSDFKIVAVSAYGNDSVNQVATDGYYTVYIGGLNPAVSVNASMNSLMPIIIALASMTILVGLVVRLRNRL
ncbi:MAG: hypothetical protein KatS3mg003_1434 [Candidatus Nitrosocaldaceae archaeon]|nr:MAG: hypothetical protein KatS3mg003_1434 [Candidatus Nitrosocaldaceae archaeon]